MVVLGESNLDVDFLAGLFADQLVFKSGNKRTGTQLQRIGVALAALKFYAVNRTDKVDNGGVAFLRGSVFFNLDRFAAGLRQILQSLVNFFGGNFGCQLFKFNFGKISGFDFRQFFQTYFKLQILAFAESGNFNVGHHCRTQLFVLNQLFGGASYRLVNDLAHNRSLVLLLQHGFRSLARTETGEFDVLGNFVEFVVDFLFKVFGGNNDLEFFFQAFRF